MWSLSGIKFGRKVSAFPTVSDVIVEGEVVGDALISNNSEQMSSERV